MYFISQTKKLASWLRLTLLTGQASILLLFLCRPIFLSVNTKKSNQIYQKAAHTFMEIENYRYIHAYIQLSLAAFLQKKKLRRFALPLLFMVFHLPSQSPFLFPFQKKSQLFPFFSPISAFRFWIDLHLIAMNSHLVLLWGGFLFSLIISYLFTSFMLLLLLLVCWLIGLIFRSYRLELQLVFIPIIHWES